MFLKRTSRNGRILAIIVAMTVVTIPVGLCQTNSMQEDEPASSETVEEIVVYGEKSLVHLRHEVHRAEDRVFDVFNTLNSDDEYDIHCYREAPIGSHIHRRVCRANFVSKATAAEARALLLRLPNPIASATIQKKTERLLEEMEALAKERPELLNALSELSGATQTYKSEHQRRCEGRVLTCRK